MAEELKKEEKGLFKWTLNENLDDFTFMVKETKETYAFKLSEFCLVWLQMAEVEKLVYFNGLKQKAVDKLANMKDYTIGEKAAVVLETLRRLKDDRLYKAPSEGGTRGTSETAQMGKNVKAALLEADFAGLQSMVGLKLITQAQMDAQVVARKLTPPKVILRKKGN